IDHNAIVLLRELDRQCRLAAGGRPGYQDRVCLVYKVAHHMAFVATLIAHPSNPVLSAELGELAADVVKASGLYWLADGVACDLVLRDDADVEAAEADLRTTVSSVPVDVVVQQAETRRKKILIADMDSTMIGQEC